MKIHHSLFPAFAALLLMSCRLTHAGDDGSSAGRLQSDGTAALHTIMSRTSVRRFTSQPIEAEKVETLLRAAMAAPTDKNLQPWHFVVLATDESIASFAEKMPHGERLRQTPLIIVVCGDMERAQEGEKRGLWVEDVSAATENLLLAAHALGLGAVWTTGYPVQEKVDALRAALELPDALVPLALVRIGYPEVSPQPKDKWDASRVTYL